MNDVFITTNGVQIQRPTPDSPSIGMLENGRGYVAVTATPEQVKSYYSAASMANVPVQWADAFGSTYGTSIQNTRYDTANSVDPLDQTPKKQQDQMAYIRTAYETVDPLVTGLVNVMVELTSGRLNLEGGDEQLRKQFRRWYLNIDVQDFIEAIALEYWITGNAIIHRRTEPFLKKHGHPFTRKEQDTGDNVEDVLTSLGNHFDPDHEADALLMKALQAKFAVAAPKLRFTKTELPVDYSVLDPTVLEATGDSKHPTFTQTVDGNLRREIQNAETADQLGVLIRKYGNDFIEDVRSSKPRARLNMDEILTLYHKKSHYRHWGYIQGASAIPFIQLKRRLRDLSMNTVSQAINFVIVFKLGSDEMPTNEDELKALSTLWNSMPRKNVAQALFRPHNLEIEVISPPEHAMQMLSSEVFDSPNIQIGQAWGVNLAIVTGITKGTVSFSVASMGMRATMRRIVTAHRKIEELLWREHLAIGESLGYEEEEIPKPVFGATGLESYAEVASAFSQALDRGLPWKYYLENGLGLHFDTVIEQAQFEEDLAVDDLMPNRGSPTQVSPDAGKPFGDPNPDPNNTSDDPGRTPSEGLTYGGNMQEDYQNMRRLTGDR